MKLTLDIYIFLNLEDTKGWDSTNQCEVERSDKRMGDEALFHMAEESPLSY